ncbi:small multi-drug export protein [Haloarchaeobius amylolyticus]|uniref:Small multi-drug export protein n=1 Tax=Haloarchaeobius amylolyticus TaxID=1198296 RepID=A0ABD6BF65_9EURY
MMLTPLLVDVAGTLAAASGPLRYALVFLFAAIPVVEILVVVPAGIGLGLDPVATGVVAFAGNVTSVYALVAFHRRLSRWLRTRRPATDQGPSDRYARARSLWDRYGLPGLAVGGPVLTGVHVAALVALLAGSSSRPVAGWMTVGIGVWTVLLVAGSAFGLSLLGLA